MHCLATRERATAVSRHMRDRTEKFNNVLLAPTETWTEESIRLCLPLYLSLMPANHNLIQP